MPPREDETYRNSVGGHTRTCTCEDCTQNRQGVRTKVSTIAHTETDWQEFTDSIHERAKERAAKAEERASAEEVQRQKAEEARRWREEEKLRLRPAPALTSNRQQATVPQQPPNSAKKSFWQRLLDR